MQIIDVITGLEEDPGDGTPMKLYPNPATGFVNIEFADEYSGNFDILIYNSLGRKVKEYSFVKNGEYSQVTIDLHGLSQGLYFLLINQESLKQYTAHILLK